MKKYKFNVGQQVLEVNRETGTYTVGPKVEWLSLNEALTHPERTVREQAKLIAEKRKKLRRKSK